MAPSLARCLEEVVARQPDALAVVTGPRQLTFGDLGEQAARLAVNLESARPGDRGPIAIVAPPGAPLAIATFAALTLGRACLPLDPGMPAVRRERILVDSGATLLVSAVDTSAHAADATGACAFNVATIGEPATAPATHPHIHAPDAPAMILYTSGSTGAPKGVVYAHGAILERIVRRDRFAVGPGDRIGVFGAAGMNLFRAVLRGAALVTWDIQRDGFAGIGDWIEREEITVLHCLPTLFRQWVDATPAPRAWPRLRCVSLTGEPVIRNDVVLFRRVFPAHCVLVNGLGTTEAGTFCQWTLDNATQVDTEIVPVGYAVEGTVIRLVDADGASVAAGAVGEIAVHGNMLAAGYWQRNDLEAARFRPEGALPGARFYLTGDIGRQLPNGALLHLGRNDLQVKIRGVRVEVAEVEGILMAHPSVREAAVVGRAAGAGESRLIACITARAWHPDLASELARFVRTRLPDAMVPDGWAFVAALPLTPSSKVDRRALPDPPPRREHRPQEGIIERFTRVAARCGDAVAYRLGDNALTYAELDSRSRLLAKQLVARGVGREHVVAVALARDPIFAVALLAILRAGGACLPLDPNGPRERNAAMLRESGARVLLASRTQDLGTALELVRIDPDAASDFEACAPAAESTGHPFDPERLAFVLYTSGSTGRPKAVEISERQVLHRLAWDWQARPYAPGEVACQRGAIGFVDTIAEWLGPLLCGVTTAIIPDALLLQPREMIAALAAARVSRILLVPTQLDLLLQAAPDLAHEIPALRLWTASGEPLTRATVERFRHAVPDGELWNVYGATEAWDATCHRVDATEAIIPIGRPLPGMRAYVLDDALAPVPVGTAGELYVAGAGLARGYRGDDALTHERFPENPFSPGSGDRLYRTGDRARMRDDGLLECLGRADRRVKINGVRIELGEIEAVLASHAAVREVAVIHADARTVAYVVGREHVGIDAASLRAFAREHLPAAALPREIVVLPALPRNARGKIERSVLVAPPRYRERSRTELERTLVQIFVDLLGHRRIGATDDFFDQGGDSLLGVRLVAEIEALTGRAFRLDALAAAPTPRGIAETLGRSWSAWMTDSRITINPSGTAPPLFGICGAWGYAVRLLRLGRALGEDVPFHALQPPQMKWPEGIGLRAMAAHYRDEILRAQPYGPYQIIGTSFGGIMAFEVARQLQAQGHTVALLCAVDSGPPGSRLKPPPAPAGAASGIEQAGRRVYLAHRAAANDYTPDAAYAGRMIYFRCAGAKRSIVREWGRLLRDTMEIVPVPGIHGDFHIEPQLGAIAAHLRAVLLGAADSTVHPPAQQWSFAYRARYRENQYTDTASTNRGRGSIADE
ncbi:MAG: amino acid adenylation domain-containing protein [Pseudomonadota bacterium]|nr:amino acid adenylation domain-containing protein [Pseudomonadota bacterium]